MFSEDTARLRSILKLISSEHSDIWFDKCDFLTSGSIRISLRFKSIPDCQNEWHLILIHRPKLINRIYRDGRQNNDRQKLSGKGVTWYRNPATACGGVRVCRVKSVTA